MRNYTLDPTALGEAPTRECKGCGYQTHAANVHGDPFCMDCEAMAEAVKAPYLNFHAALAVDPELQKAFSWEDETFDSGHEVFCCPSGGYQIMGLDGFYADFGGGRFTVDLPEVIQWCIQHREELV